jgi:signal transduction histidine kinase
MSEREDPEQTIRALRDEIEMLEFRLQRLEKIKRTTAIFLDESVAELEAKREAVEEANTALEAALAALKVDHALERVRSRAVAMQSPEELLDVVLTMYEEYHGLGFPCEMFWHAKWTEKGYEKALTGVGGKKIEFIMDLPRDFSAVPALMEWERSEEPLGVFKFDPDAAVQYLRHMIEDGDFHRIDPEAVTEDDVRHSGGFTFVQARTTHGEIGFLLFGETDPSEEAKAVLLRFAKAFDFAYRRFEDLKQAESDLKQLQAAQEQLLHSEKLASLGSLTAGIAHEIKNPLNFVNNFADVSRELVDELADALEAGPDGAEEARAIMADLRANAEQIAKHGGRADAIVRSMMQHARGGTAERMTVDVNAFLAEYVDLAWHGMRAKDHLFECDVVRELDPDVGAFTVQSQDLGRVVLNLLNNAFYAVAMEGAASKPVVRVTSERTRAGAVVISVADSGPGIPEDIRQKIFEPFFTTKPTGEGTGLGLSLSHDIVTKGHGGTMTAVNAPGGGAVFTLTLP